METLNCKRMKRFISRTGDLKYNYDTTITSDTFDGTGTTYNLTFEAQEVLGQTIDVTLQIVDNVLIVENTTAE